MFCVNLIVKNPFLCINFEFTLENCSKVCILKIFELNLKKTNDYSVINNMETFSFY